MRGLGLSVALLQDEGASSVQDTDLVGRDGGGVTPGVEAVSRCLTAQQLDARIVDERSVGTDRVRSAAHARHDDVGQASFRREQLRTRLVADNAL